jgi:CRP/FNR family transcriptional regulator, anaerobic regulatory protein
MSALNLLIKKQLPFLEDKLIEQIIEHAADVTLPPNQQILREGQYIKTIPLVINGLLKVITSHGDKEILLYYIQPSESCVMSFAFSMSDEPSKISAFTETETRALILNASDVKKWITDYPSINLLFLNQYNMRYKDLVDTIGELIYEKLDVRIYNYLKQRVAVSGNNVVDIPHRQIADEIASSREVVTRALKKLETEKKIEQTRSGIKVL